MTVETDSLFLGDVIIILSKELQKKSQYINIQNYIVEGNSFIPVFSSIEKYEASTHGIIDNPVIVINGLLLLSMMNGDEQLRLNPGLDDERDFRASKLQDRYANRIEEFKHKLASQSFR